MASSRCLPSTIEYLIGALFSIFWWRVLMKIYFGEVKPVQNGVDQQLTFFNCPDVTHPLIFRVYFLYVFCLNTDKE